MTFNQRLKSVFAFRNPLQILLNRFLFNQVGPTLYQYRNVEFVVDHNAGDQDGPRACVVPGLYDTFLATIAPDQPVRFIDLGANAGGFLLSLLKSGIQIEKGVAVELNPKTWARLVYNAFQIVPNAEQCLRLENAAVTTESGFLEIRLGRGSVGDNVSGQADGELHKIRAITLQQIIEDFGTEIDILKIDIEGMEYELALTRIDALQRVRWIVIEIHHLINRKPSEVISWLQSCGFTEITPFKPPPESNVYLFKNNRSPVMLPFPQ